MYNIHYSICIFMCNWLHNAKSRSIRHFIPYFYDSLIRDKVKHHHVIFFVLTNTITSPVSPTSVGICCIQFKLSTYSGALWLHAEWEYCCYLESIDHKLLSETFSVQQWTFLWGTNPSVSVVFYKHCNLKPISTWVNKLSYILILYSSYNVLYQYCNNITYVYRFSV